MLNTKHFEILKELKKEDELQRIANIFNQTERNIRYKIAELNESLGERKIIIKKRKIFCFLEKEDIISLIGGINKYNYIYRQQERLDYLILESILEKDEFCIEEIASTLEISKSTIRADVKLLKDKLAKTGIDLKQYNDKKCVISYKNSDLIYCLAIFLYQYVVFDAEEKSISYKKSNYFEMLVGKKLSKLYGKQLEEIYLKIKNAGLCYTDETLNLLILLICVLKNRKINSVKLDVLNKKVLNQTKEYKILSKTFDKFSEMDICFLTDYLLRISCDEKEIFLRHKNWIEIELGVYRIIKEFEKLKNVELVKSKKLIDDILFYIKPLIYRSIKGIELKNSVLKEVKSIYGDTFKYLKKAFENFEKLLNIEISDNEIGFLVPIFEVALKNQVERAKRVAIVSSFKKNLINFLISRLKEEFLIDIVDIVSIKQSDKLRDRELDLVIMTSEGVLKIDKNIPICKVSPILTETDIRMLSKMKLPYQSKKISLDRLVSVIKRNVQGCLDETRLIEDLMDNFSGNITTEKLEKETEKFEIPKHLIKISNTKSLLEIIKLGNEILLNEKYISKGYLEEMMSTQVEDLLYFFLNDNTVLIYVDPKDNVLKTGFSIIKIKKALNFKDKKVKNFIFFAPKGDAKDQKVLFELNDYFEKSKLKNKV